ncbi:MAG: VacB/RNase II family 3'-5' exoribonuclease, partial [Deferribacterales bacterium]|nr:VacB/RNase II family 3'-5' exoribonuclease [Deferribacterales bacterium]
HRDGYAFFIPDDKNTEDLFIHPKNLNGAVHGDKVTVKAGIFNGKKEATVVKILERGLTTFIGYADITRRRFDVYPLSKNFIAPMRIIEDNFNCMDGDIVRCKIERYPSDRIFGEASIAERICHCTDKEADNKIVMGKYELSIDFPKAVSLQADKIESGKFNNSMDGVADFRSLFAVTIDGDTAKDYDDAISVEYEQGKIILYVHIADVSRFVLKGSPIDEEAKKRGTSVYFPEFAIPMLPEALSNGLCSLLPNQDRFTVTAKIVFSDNGHVLNTSFYRSIINSRHRLTYGYVNNILNGTENAHNKDLKLFIDRAVKLYHILDNKRKSAGGIDFDLPEAVFTFDDSGMVSDITPCERGISERIIEYFMIAANEAVAEFLFKKKRSAIYRVHGEPDLKKIDIWLETAGQLGVSVPDKVYPLTTVAVRELACIAEKSKYSFILSPMLVRCMMRAEYAVENKGHFGLASKAYTHFTSPIRRYPDLLVHRALLECIGFKFPCETSTELSELAPVLSELERKADEAESEISCYKKLEYLNRNFSEIYDAYINRITSGGLSIYINKLTMTGFIDFATINYDVFSMDSNGISASGRRTKDVFKIGDKVQVKVERTSLILQKAEFSIANSRR